MHRCKSWQRQARAVCPAWPGSKAASSRQQRRTATGQALVPPQHRWSVLVSHPPHLARSMLLLSWQNCSSTSSSSSYSCRHSSNTCGRGVCRQSKVRRMLAQPRDRCMLVRSGGAEGRAGCCAILECMISDDKSICDVWLCYMGTSSSWQSSASTHAAASQSAASKAVRAASSCWQQRFRQSPSNNNKPPQYNCSSCRAAAPVGWRLRKLLQMGGSALFCRAHPRSRVLVMAA